VFPSATKDYFGLKNFGINYGLVFSAWGVGGFVFPRISQMIVAQTGSPEAAYIMCAILLMASSLMALMTNAPESIPEGVSLLDRFRAKSAMARKQPVGAYIGTRYK
jgi:nitrate/nitrite transporter NarK